MTNRRVSDLTATLAVLEGRRNPIDSQKTWLGHKADSEAGQIDLHLLEGNSVLDIANAIPCRARRVEDHFGHLQSGPSTMEPHGLKLKQVSGKWYFDQDWIRNRILTVPSS